MATPRQIAETCSPFVAEGSLHPENVESHFYCVPSYCLACRLPEEEAPELLGFSEAEPSNQSHCFFKKQPDTLASMARAVEALKSCCCGALRYAGSAPKILQSLRDAGMERQCDTLE